MYIYRLDVVGVLFSLRRTFTCFFFSWSFIYPGMILLLKNWFKWKFRRLFIGGGLKESRLLHTHTVFAQNSNMISWLLMEWKIVSEKRHRTSSSSTHAHAIFRIQNAVWSFSLSLLILLNCSRTYTFSYAQIYTERELWWWRFGPFWGLFFPLFWLSLLLLLV